MIRPAVTIVPAIRNEECTVGDRQAEHQVLRARTVLSIDQCIEVDSGFDVVDYWRSSDAERTDVATGQRRVLNRAPQRFSPHHLSGSGVQSIDDVILGSDEQKLPIG